MSDIQAFPSDEKAGDGSHWASHSGMSLRDWFAGQVLPAIWLNNYQQELGLDLSQIASDAYMQADAMLAERAKGDNK